MTDLETWVTDNFTVTAKRGAERNVKCRLHDDQTASASINVEKMVYNCAVCGGFSLWQISRRLGIAPPQVKTSFQTYKYENENGQVIYEIRRFTNKRDGKKDFKAFDPRTQEYGIGKVEKVPYHLPEVLAAIKAGRPVFIAEGEKDCDTLAARGYAATTNCFGCSSTKQWEGFVKYFPAGTLVYVFPDHDEPGMKHAERICDILSEAEVDVRLVDLGYPVEEKHGKDITDWSANGHTKSNFESLLKNAKQYATAKIEKGSEMLSGDYGHATVLAPYFTTSFRWARHKGKWLAYTGKLWDEVDAEYVLLRSAEYLKDEYKRRLDQKIDKDNRKFYEKGFIETNLTARIKGSLEFLRGWPGITIAGEELDKDPWLLNLDNGTLHLKTLKLQPHNPADLITKLAPISYNPDAKDGEWQKHLELFLPNESIRREFQRNMGIGLTGAVMDEILPIWYGTGGNGKTTTAQAITRILGNYVRTSRATLLMNDDKHPEAIADLAGSRFVFCSEITAGTALAEGLVKSLTGGESKRARFLYGSRFTFEQTFSLFLLVNDKPKITGTDDGIWRRLRIIPWTVKLPKRQQLSQDTILAKLVSNGSAILNWMIDGLHDFIEDRAWVAPEVEAATANYRAHENVLHGFLTTCTEPDASAKSSTDELYKSLSAYCQEKCEPIKTKQEMGKFLVDQGYEKKNGTGNRQFYHGLKLKQEYMDHGMFAEKSVSEIVDEVFNG